MPRLGVGQKSLLTRQKGRYSERLIGPATLTCSDGSKVLKKSLYEFYQARKKAILTF